MTTLYKPIPIGNNKFTGINDPGISQRTKKLLSGGIPDKSIKEFSKKV
tara:strand:- start:1832 stop:1975 length:144 start_codon:yes stop_codon:yes gene_type:complete